MCREDWILVIVLGSVVVFLIGFMSLIALTANEETWTEVGNGCYIHKEWDNRLFGEDTHTHHVSL